MFEFDEVMTDLILTACRERLRMDPVPLDFGGLVASLDAELAGLMPRRGQRCRARIGALRGQTLHGGRLVRQPSLPLFHPGGPDEGVAAL